MEAGIPTLQKLRMTDAVADQWNRAAEFHNFVLEVWPIGTYKSTPRNLLFSAFGDLVIEHHGAVLTLIKNLQSNGSALALLRPIIETCTRAFWILHCAKEQVIPLLVKGEKEFPTLHHALEGVEAYFAKQTKSGIFRISNAYLGQLHGLTHTGLEQLQFRFDSNLNLVPTYPDKTLCQLLRESTTWLAYMAIVRMQFIEGTDERLSPNTNRITERFLQIFGKL